MSAIWKAGYQHGAETGCARRSPEIHLDRDPFLNREINHGCSVRKILKTNPRAIEQRVISNSPVIDTQMSDLRI